MSELNHKIIKTIYFITFVILEILIPNDRYLRKYWETKHFVSNKNVRKKLDETETTSKSTYSIWEKNFKNKFTSRSGYDVLSGSPSQPPLLPTTVSVNHLLSGRVRVNSGHQPLNNTEAIIDNFHQGRQSVCGARSARHDFVGFRVIWLVHAHHERGGVGRRSWNDDSFGATL